MHGPVQDIYSPYVVLLWGTLISTFIEFHYFIENYPLCVDCETLILVIMSAVNYTLFMLKQIEIDTKIYKVPLRILLDHIL
jgi:hypothetical protein